VNHHKTPLFREESIGNAASYSISKNLRGGSGLDSVASPPEREPENSSSNHYGEVMNKLFKLVGLAPESEVYYRIQIYHSICPFINIENR
jgi:hypothetical protein